MKDIFSILFYFIFVGIIIAAAPYLLAIAGIGYALCCAIAFVTGVKTF